MRDIIYQVNLSHKGHYHSTKSIIARIVKLGDNIKKHRIDSSAIIYLLMQQKLIVTLWKAQLPLFPKQDSIYCRLTYNSQQRNSKPTSHNNNLTWKETFVMPLARKELPLRMEFIGIKPGQEIHFAKDNVLESLSYGRATVNIAVEGSQHGSLPCKVDILDTQEQAVGKIFIEYEVMKTEVAYTVDKQLDYYYLLKLTNFRVKFIRNLRKTPKFYLRCHLDGRTHRQDLPFEQDDSQGFIYSYPVKLYLKKQLEMQLQLFVGEDTTLDYRTESSFDATITSDHKSNKSSNNKKDKHVLDLGKDKITANMDLNFKKDTKVTRKLPLTTIVKAQKREIGVIEFQVEAFFRTKEELQQLEQQKRGLHIEPPKSPERKRNLVKQTNGVIIVNSILGKLQLFNDSIIEGRNMSIELLLGKQTQQSQVLERPGKELIFIDTFVFKRTWEETVKIIVNLCITPTQKSPTFFAQVNLRELFEIGRYISKKVKLKDENKNYSGELVLDMVYRQEQKKSPSLKESMASIPEVIKEDEALKLKAKLKRSQIEERIRRREEEKERSRQLNSMSTLAVLQDNDILLPPLKSYSRMQTISPNKPEKFRAANVFNVNGCIKFSKSPRFDSNQKPGYESYTYVRDSDFDLRHKRGTSIGLGSKYDFTLPLAKNPGVGRYEINSLWDKYK